ncbi:MAG TPA: acyl-CoA dehydrogenase, partial [Sporichthya sp.]|nr:acyl-CoA dehydrogenase [Sporichthya sp.]
MALEFSLPERVMEWQDRIRDFVEEVVVPREQEAFARGADDDLRRELQAAAKEAVVFAPQAAADLGGGG